MKEIKVIESVGILSSKVLRKIERGANEEAKMMYDNETCRVKRLLRYIQGNIERRNLNNGIYSSAEFTTEDGRHYVVVDKIKTEDVNLGSKIFEIVDEKWVPLTVSNTSNGDRGLVTVGGTPIMDYRLIVFCLVENAYAYFLCDISSDYVVNHKTITDEDVRTSRKIKAKQARLDEISNKICDAYRDNNLAEVERLTNLWDAEHKEKTVVDMKITDVYDLEICTLSDNAKHSNFVHRNGLVGVSVSAKDIKYLELATRNYAQRLADLYSTEGIDAIKGIALNQ